MGSGRPDQYEEPAVLVESEVAAIRWARIGVMLMAVGFVTTTVLYLVLFSTFADWVNDLDSYEAGDSFPQMPSAFAWFNLFAPLQLGSWIVILIWQHKAATAALSLRLPARRSPGFGVASWFIPVVNLWFPYQAIADCLPVYHPNRPLVLRWWLGMHLSFLVVVPVAVAAYFGGLLIGVLAFAALIAYAAWWGRTGVRMVEAIGSCHQETCESIAGALSQEQPKGLTGSLGPPPGGPAG